MKLNLLWSGWVTPIPRPTCFCHVCREAREKGIPYERTTCSLFVYDNNMLFDAGEDSKLQLNRERIEKVEHLILTHRHPDHTHGLRILENINWDFEHKRPRHNPINVYISDFQKEMLTKMSCWGFLDYYTSKWIIQLHPLNHKEQIITGDTVITPYYIEKTKAFYFLIEKNQKRVIYAMCEYDELKIYEDIKDVDIYISHTLFWENPNVSPRKIPPIDEDTFEKMLGDAAQVNAKKIILTHIEESFKLTHDELIKNIKKYYPNENIVVWYDGMIIDL